MSIESCNGSEQDSTRFLSPKAPKSLIYDLFTSYFMSAVYNSVSERDKNKYNKQESQL